MEIWLLVVEHDQVAELLGAGQRRGLARHAFFHVAVGGDHIDEVVERAGAGGGVRIEQAALVPRRHRHPDGRREALAQRSGGDFHAGGVTELGMPRGPRPPRPQRRDVGELQPEPAEIQLDVERQAAVPGGQHESVATQPVEVAGVVAHLALKQRVRQRRQAHRGPRMAVADLVHRVRRQHPNGVDRGRVQLRPVVRVIRAGEGRNLVDCGHEAHSFDMSGFGDPL